MLGEQGIEDESVPEVGLTAAPTWDNSCVREKRLGNRQTEVVALSLGRCEGGKRTGGDYENAS